VPACLGDGLPAKILATGKKQHLKLGQSTLGRLASFSGVHLNLQSYKALLETHHTTTFYAPCCLLRGVDAPMATGSIWSRLRIPQSGTARATAVNLLGFATWIPVIAWFNLHVFELTLVDGSSMHPYMNEDKDSTLRRDVILNYKWSPQEGLERGMIVTLRLVCRCRPVQEAMCPRGTIQN
jgi:hypothetical protein